MQTLTCISKQNYLHGLKKERKLQIKEKECNSTAKRNPTELCKCLYRVKGQKDFKKDVLVLHMFSIQMHHKVASAHNPT